MHYADGGIHFSSVSRWRCFAFSSVSVAQFNAVSSNIATSKSGCCQTQRRVLWCCRRSSYIITTKLYWGGK